MGFDAIIREVREFTPAKMPLDMYNSKNCFEQFLHIDNTPVYKVSCTDYDMLMEKVSDMMCEDVRLNIVVPFKSFVILNDTIKYDEVVVHKLPGMEKYYDTV